VTGAGGRDPGPTRGEDRRGSRDAILTAAIECFSRNGIGATSMEEIAQTAGVSRVTIYYHYANKHMLVQAVLLRRGAELLDVIQSEIEGEPLTLELLIQANLRSIELSAADPVANLLVSPEAEHLTAELLESEQMLEVHRAFWTPLLTQARDAGILNPELDLDELIIWQVFLQFSLTSLGPEFRLSGPGKVRHLLRTYLAPALRPPRDG
jgi:AcrR family transcriptional regulator